eukprot:11187051-Lingulodinium_polyedra.AAC.1
MARSFSGRHPSTWVEDIWAFGSPSPPGGPCKKANGGSALRSIPSRKGFGAVLMRPLGSAPASSPSTPLPWLPGLSSGIPFCIPTIWKNGVYFLRCFSEA